MDRSLHRSQHRTGRGAPGRFAAWRRPVWWMFLLVTAACVRDRNPFLELDNARAHVVARSFGTIDEHDSVRIFSAETLQIVVAVREEVDSFVVIVPGNRAGDTIVCRPNTAAEPWDARHLVIFSLSDTGRTTLAVATHRSSGEVVVDKLPVRAWSPLRQPAVFGGFGQNTPLATDSVRDRNVWYCWSFGDVVVRSAFPRADTAIPPTADTIGGGFLWVTDVAGRQSSPKTPFCFRLIDVVAPTLTVLTPLCGLDTLCTGDDAFELLVRIVDPGSGIVATATVNGVQPARIFGSEYSWRIDSVRARAAGGAYPLLLEARDRVGNPARDTLWLVHSDSLAHTGALALSILSPTPNPAIVRNSSLQLLGALSNAATDSVDAQVSVRTSDSMYAAVRVTGVGRVLWRQSMVLPDSVDTIHIEARDLRSAAIVDTDLVVRVDSTTPDVESPVIVEFLVDGKPGPDVHTQNDTVDVRIIAFDQGSGIAQVSVDGREAWPVADTGYLWTARAFAPHVRDGALLTVTVRDRVGLVAAASVRVTANRPPQLLSRPCASGPARAGVLYRDSLYVLDRDGDPVTMAISGPPGMALDGMAVSWIPSDADATVGFVRVTTALFDGFDSTVAACSLQVLPRINAPCSLSVRADRGILQDGVLSLFRDGGPATVVFSVLDADPTSVDHHTVTVTFAGSVSVTTVDTTRQFSMTIDPVQSSAARDTIRALVVDGGGSRNALMLVVVYRDYVAPMSAAQTLYLNVASAGLSAPVVQFPLLVRLDTSSFDFRRVNTIGGLRFSSASGTPLSYEVEMWDTASRRAALWVLVDTIYAAQDSQPIFMRWDSTAGGMASDPGRVFDTANGFVGVWHLADDPGAGVGSIKDATSSAENGTPHGNMTAANVTPGAIGNGTRFVPTSSQFVTISADSRVDITGRNSMGFSAWVMADAFDTRGNWNRIIGKGDAQYSLQHAWGAGGFEFVVSGTTGDWCTAYAIPPDNPRTGTWYYVCGSYNALDGTARLYRDGSLRSSVACPDISAQSDDTLAIGSLYAGNPADTRYWDGILDEVQMHRVARSADWIRLCYESQKPGSTFIRTRR